MKKLASILFVAIGFLSLTACSSSDSNSATSAVGGGVVDGNMVKGELTIKKEVTPESPVQDSQPEPVTTTPEPDFKTDPVVKTLPNSPAPAVKNFSMEANRFNFVPSTITVNKGDTVKLTITSTDVDHGISLPAFGVKQRLPAGSARTVTFVADKSGTFPFLCTVFCGSGHGGMRGSLVVR